LPYLIKKTKRNFVSKSILGYYFAKSNLVERKLIEMKPDLGKLIFALPIVGLLIIVIFFPKINQKVQAEQSVASTAENYDIRLDKSKAAQETISDFRQQSGKSDAHIAAIRQQMKTAEENLRKSVPLLKVEYNEDLKIPETIGPDVTKGTGFLTAPSIAQRPDILRDFLLQNNQLVGLTVAQIKQLKVTANYKNPNGNLSFVTFEQYLNGLPVFRGEVKAGFTKLGEIIRVINNLAPGLDDNISTEFGSAEKAVQSAAAKIQNPVAEKDLRRVAVDNFRVTFERAQFDREITAEKVYFPIEIGVVRTAWRFFLWEKVNAYYIIVDAETGKLLWRKNITDFQTKSATYNIYKDDSPTPYSPGPLSPENPPFRPLFRTQPKLWWATNRRINLII
jgi:hypothetical protein